MCLGLKVRGYGEYEAGRCLFKEGEGKKVQVKEIKDKSLVLEFEEHELYQE